jgi:hypothetical protein
MINFFKKIIKLFLAGAFTIIVAACYGVYMDYRYLFHVKNPEGAPLQNIRVTLIEDGATVAEDFTDSNGEVMVQYASFGTASCEIVIMDIDGAENGGEFQAINTTVYADVSDMTEYSFTMYPVE